MKNSKKPFSKLKFLRLLVLSLLLFATVISLLFQQPRDMAPPRVVASPPPESSISPVSSMASASSTNAPDERKQDLHAQEFKLGSLGPDDERRAYEGASLVLYIPRLGYTGAVLEGMSLDFKNGDPVTTAMDDTVLNNGVALFNQSMLPGSGNRNVSIAGHRDIHGMEFYYIDSITEGDLLYLYYDGKQYTYLYYDTNITHSTDWTYVKTNEHNTLTLQSCDPINVASERIFVSARLQEVRKLSAEEIISLQKKFPSFDEPMSTE